MLLIVDNFCNHNAKQQNEKFYFLCFAHISGVGRNNGPEQLQETYELNNGVMMPKLGFGTWQIPEEQVAIPVMQAVKAGYRHIDQR